MTKSVKWNLSLFVQDGPTLTSSHSIDADAVDILDVEVDAESAIDKAVDVQPGDSSQVVLDKDHIITSIELAKLFGDARPNQIKLVKYNNYIRDHRHRFVARKAT